MRPRVLAFVFVIIAYSPGMAFAAPAPAGSSGLELSELLVDPAAPQTDANDEYVELHNAGTVPVALGGYKLRVGSSSTLHTLPSQTVAPGDYVVLTSAASPWALTNTGGTISLQDASGAVLDTTAWTKAPTGSAWARIGGAWAWTAVPTPGAANLMGPGPGKGASAETGGAAAPLELNELLPDPAAPQTDANDEYVEIYNPNSAPIDLAGYVVKTGATLSTKHVLKSVLVPAEGYLALRSADTKIALANAGSSVALFDPSGVQLGATVTYGKAPTGSAWARIDDTWAWTATPTPGGANIITEPPAVATTTSASKTKSSSAAKAGSSKTAAAKTTKAKATKATKAAKAAKTEKSGKSIAAAASTTGGRWLLFALAGLTIAYVIYEFRYDLRNIYFRLRGYPGSGSPLGEAAKGRGSDRTGERPGRGQDHLRPGARFWSWLRRRGHQPDVHA